MSAHAAGHGRQHKLRFSPRARAAIYSILGAAWVTGLGWLVLRHFLRRPGEFGLVPHPLEPWAQRLHGASAFAALSLMGMLWTTHVVRAWRRHLRPPSGFAVLAVLAALAVTGYLLYYVGSEDARARIALAHWVIGLAGPLLLIVHVCQRGRERRRRAFARAINPRLRRSTRSAAGEGREEG